MAEIQGSTVNIEVDLAGGTTYETVVCQTSGSVSSTRPITTTQTNCGSRISVGVPETTISGDFVLETAPGVGETTFGDILTVFHAGTAVSVRVSDPTGPGTSFYIQGTAYITDLELTWATEETVSFSATWTISGTVDTTVGA